MARYARTHVPFTTADVALRLGLGAGRGRAGPGPAGRVAAGWWPASSCPAAPAPEWCDAEVLRTLRRRSLAALRKEVEPVPVEALASFLPGWQQVGGRLRGAEGVLRVVEQLQGAQVPASALESLVLPARVAGYSPALLDELCAAGEVLWRGHGALPGGDGWVSLHLADTAHLTMPAPDPTPRSAARCTRRSLDALAGGGAFFFRRLSDVAGVDRRRRPWSPRCGTSSGPGTSPTTPWRRCATLVAGGGAHKARRPPPRGRYGRGRPGDAQPHRPAGRGRPLVAAARASRPTRPGGRHTLAEVLLDRHGVVIRGAVVAERAPGGFAAVYRVLAAFEETGRCRRGYFVEGSRRRAVRAAGRGRPAARGGALRWSGPTRTRAPSARRRRRARWCSRRPTRPTRSAPPCRGRPAATGEDAGHKPGRKAGALVVLVDGGWSSTSSAAAAPCSPGPTTRRLLQPAVDALSLAVREGQLGRLTVERADGAGVLDSPLGRALEEAGFHATPRGLRLRK